MSTRRRLLVAATFVVGALGLVIPSSSAQEQPAPGAEVINSWALSPQGSQDPGEAGNRPTFSYEVDPGAVLEDGLTLFNYSNVQLTFAVYATDAFNTDDGEFALLETGAEPTDVGSWITLPQANVTVPAQSQVSMPITIKVPADVRPGDHVGAILASNAAAGTGPDGKVVSLDRRTGSRVYIRVAGPVEPELAIENVKTTYSPSLNPFGGTAKVTYRIQNRGNVRLTGSHSVSISGPFGSFEEKKAAKDLPELLPGDGVTLHATFDGISATALLNTEVRLDPTGADSETLSTTTRTGRSLAPPITLIFLALATWLALRARRSYRRHRDGERALAGSRS